MKKESKLRSINKKKIKKNNKKQQMKSANQRVTQVMTLVLTHLWSGRKNEQNN